MDSQSAACLPTPTPASWLHHLCQPASLNKSKTGWQDVTLWSLLSWHSCRNIYFSPAQIFRSAFCQWRGQASQCFWPGWPLQEAQGKVDSMPVTKDSRMHDMKLGEWNKFIHNFKHILKLKTRRKTDASIGQKMGYASLVGWFIGDDQAVWVMMDPRRSLTQADRIFTAVTFSSWRLHDGQDVSLQKYIFRDPSIRPSVEERYCSGWWEARVREGGRGGGGEETPRGCHASQASANTWCVINELLI